MTDWTPIIFASIAIVAVLALAYGFVAAVRAIISRRFHPPQPPNESPTTIRTDEELRQLIHNSLRASRERRRDTLAGPRLFEVEPCNEDFERPGA